MGSLLFPVYSVLFTDGEGNGGTVVGMDDRRASLCTGAYSPRSHQRSGGGRTWPRELQPQVGYSPMTSYNGRRATKAPLQIFSCGVSNYTKTQNDPAPRIRASSYTQARPTLPGRWDIHILTFSKYSVPMTHGALPTKIPNPSPRDPRQATTAKTTRGKVRSDSL